MKKIKLTTSLMAVLSLTAIMDVNPVFAHDVVGTLTNGVAGGRGNSVVDSYRVQCIADPLAASQLPTDHLYIQIRDDSPGGGALTAVATILDATPAPNGPLGYQRSLSTTDFAPADGVAGAVRRLKVYNVGTPTTEIEPTFEVFVHHTINAADTYLLTAHCEDINNAHTGTEELAPLQNQ
ncbi:MAG: hypothetical protein HOP23_03060 [Methylococcaceae bacterium]|nr:hypothetical protein [Methylococcaceae bacterium]